MARTKTFTLAVLLTLLILAFASGNLQVSASSVALQKTTVIASVKTLDNLTLAGVQVSYSYNTSINHTRIGSFSLPTSINGLTNTTLQLNSTTVVHFNLTYDNAVVLRNFTTDIAANATVRINMTAGVVNWTYSVMNPNGGYLSPVRLTLQGEKGTSVARVNLTGSFGKQSLYVPVGNYNVTVYRDTPSFYSSNITVSLGDRIFNITAPLLTLSYSVISVSGAPVSAQSVALLYAGSIVGSGSGGSGRFTSLLPGTYEIIAYGDGLTNSTYVELGSDKSAAIMLPTGYFIDLRILNAFGSPLGGYTASLQGPVTVTNITGSNGNVNLGPLPGGEYVLKVYSGSKLIYTTLVSVQSSAKESINIPNYVNPSLSSSNVYAALRLALGAIFIVLGLVVVLLTLRRRGSK